MSVDDEGGGADRRSSVGDGAGAWILPAVSYVDPTRRFCELCGRPIARRYWQIAIEERKRIFCDPTHADLYATYPRSFDEMN